MAASAGALACFRTSILIQKDRGVVESIGFSLWFNQRLARQMLDLVGQLFVGKVSLKEVQGPVGIVTMSGKAARAGFGSLDVHDGAHQLESRRREFIAVPHSRWRTHHHARH